MAVVAAMAAEGMAVAEEATAEEEATAVEEATAARTAVAGTTTGATDTALRVGGWWDGKGVVQKQTGSGRVALVAWLWPTWRARWPLADEAAQHSGAHRPDCDR